MENERSERNEIEKTQKDWLRMHHDQKDNPISIKRVIEEPLYHLAIH